MAVHAQAQDAVGADDAVVVPLGAALAVIGRGKTALPVMAAERFHGRAVDGKHITVRGEPIGFLPVGLLVLLGVTVVKHLHLDGAQEWHAGRGDGRAPEEQAGVPALGQMTPLQFRIKFSNCRVVRMAPVGRPVQWIRPRAHPRFPARNSRSPTRRDRGRCRAAQTLPPRRPWRKCRPPPGTS